MLNQKNDRPTGIITKLALFNSVVINEITIAAAALIIDEREYFFGIFIFKKFLKLGSLSKN